MEGSGWTRSSPLNTRIFGTTEREEVESKGRQSIWIRGLSYAPVNQKFRHSGKQYKTCARKFIRVMSLFRSYPPWMQFTRKLQGVGRPGTQWNEEFNPCAHRIIKRTTCSLNELQQHNSEIGTNGI